jgi:hypothetical protein
MLSGLIYSHICTKPKPLGSADLVIMEVKLVSLALDNLSEIS